jgi:L-2-hydroxyglutarate oxidase LhgO
MDQVECVVVGAGVVGLAVARKIAQSGKETILLERESSFGTITSARNSEVMHAGIYYPTGSLKTEVCIRGNALLHEYAKSRGVPYNPCGKLIVASDTEQIPDLEAIWQKAGANQVPKLSRLTKAQAQTMEPVLRVEEAIFSGSTGVIDSHSYMLSLLGEFEDAGGAVAYQSKLESVTPIQEGKNGYLLSIKTADRTNFQIQTQFLINSAGLSAPKLARQIQGFPEDLIPTPYFAKGNYFSLAMKSPFSRLIYPIPEPGGLGVHVTMDLGGQAKFGPDVEWLDIHEESEVNYSVDPMRGQKFYAAIRSYWPELPDGVLSPAYSGIRAKISPPGEPAADFQILNATIHGFTGLIQLFAIESPGLTSSLAIAEKVEAALI